VRGRSDLMPTPVGADLETQLAVAQANLDLLEAHFQATIEQLPIGIAHADFDDRITRFNSAFCAMLGRTAEELRGRLFAEITYPDDKDGSAAALKRLWRGEVDYYGIDKRYIKKDGSVFWAHVTVAPSRDAAGALDGAVGILEDITERKAAEAEVERVHKELVYASRQAGMAEIAANVLHNVGNVLNSLNISASLVTSTLKHLRIESLNRVASLLHDNAQRLESFLSEGERGRQIREFLSQFSTHLRSKTEAALTEMQSLTQNIDHIKHIVATQQTYAKHCAVTETVDLAALVEDSLHMNRSAFARHGVTLTREFESVPPITVDKHTVLQILINLARNACHACEASRRTDKSIRLSIARAKDQIRIQVIDDGIGIAAEHQARLFRHGFTTKTDGHGFGLHSGALAAKELGGSLEAFSEGVGRGATFTLTLPLVPPERFNGRDPTEHQPPQS
jgi:PAS domain S-box-containing protein